MAGISWRVLVVAAALAAVVFTLSELRLVVLPVIAALLVATMLVPPVRWLRARRWPALAATWAVLLGSALGVGAIVALVAPGVAAEFDELGPAVSEGVEEIWRWVEERTPFRSSGGSDALGDRLVESLRDNAGAITTGVLGGAVVALEVVAGLLLTLVLVFFFVKDGERITGWIVRQVPPARRDVVRALGRRSWATIGGYLRGVAVVGVVNAVVIGVGLLLLGVPLVAPLMLLTFVGAFFPLVGAVIAGALAALVALVSGGPGTALVVVALVVGVQQVEGDLVSPLVFSRTVKLHPVVILLALTAGAVVGGVVGAFLSVPLVAVLAAAGNEVQARQEERGDPPREQNVDPAMRDGGGRARGSRRKRRRASQSTPEPRRGGEEP